MLQLIFQGSTLVAGLLDLYISAYALVDPAAVASQAISTEDSALQALRDASLTVPQASAGAPSAAVVRMSNLNPSDVQELRVFGLAGVGWAVIYSFCGSELSSTVRRRLSTP